MRIRKILLVHPSRPTRGLIKKYVFSELNDAEMADVQSGREGLEMLAQWPFDVVIASDRLKDMEVTDFRTRLAATQPNSHSPLIIISENESKNGYDALIEKGFDRVVQIRVRPADLIHEINAVCNPRAWRQDTRFHIPGTDVTIDTAKGAIEATLINISMGGLLVEMSTHRTEDLMAGDLQITLRIPMPDKPSTISSLTCKLLRLEVVNWNSNQTPATVRATFIFSELEERPRNKLAELIQMAGQDKLSATPIDD